MLGTREYRHAISQEVEDNIPKYVSDQPIPEKERILRYMKRREFDKRSCPSLHRDLVNKETLLGTSSVYFDYPFVWTTYDIYYFEKYNIPLEPDFIEHVLSRTE